MSAAELKNLVLPIVTFIELGGVFVIFIGLLVATLLMLGSVVTNRTMAFQDYRARIGRSILLGLEFLVAADIIRTVTVSPTLASVGALALIVLIRTFLSFVLELEIQGRWPWQSPKPEPGKFS